MSEEEGRHGGLNVGRRAMLPFTEMKKNREKKKSRVKARFLISVWRL